MDKEIAFDQIVRGNRLVIYDKAILYKGVEYSILDIEKINSDVWKRTINGLPMRARYRLMLITKFGGVMQLEFQKYGGFFLAWFQTILWMFPCCYEFDRGQVD